MTKKKVTKKSKTDKNITININTGAAANNKTTIKKAEPKKNKKRQDHYKKYKGLMVIELKNLGSNLYRSVNNLLYFCWYLFVVFGDLLLLYGANKKKNNSESSKKEKSILDGGW